MMREGRTAMSTTYISLEPIEWTQEIRDYPSINVTGRYLNVICRATANCDVLLNDKIDLRDFQSIPLGILDRESKADERLRLSKEALGGIWYIADGNFLHGWFRLKEPEWFTAVWDQVRDGNYSECDITLSVGPVELARTWIWNTDHPLSIDSVAIQFKRKPNKPSDQAKPRRGLFGHRLAR
jgi:hypothetical protein